MRFKLALCLLLGLAFLAGACVCGVLAARQAAQISAYHHASTCPAGARLDADCLHSIDGAVTGVIEIGGKSADYALDVRTGSTTLHITFTSDSPMLGFAIDGDRVAVTVWRGIPVSVSADGRTEATATVPQTAFRKDLGEGALAGGGGILFLFAAVGGWRSRIRSGESMKRPVLAAVILVLGLGLPFAMIIGGAVLVSHPSALDPALAAAAVALVIVTGLSVWLGISVRRRHRRHPADLGVRLPPLPKKTRMLKARTAKRVRARLHAANWTPVPVARTAGWVIPLLTVAVLFGLFFTAHDGPPARAFRHAPACVGEANLATCVGKFTATVNGVRTPVQGTSNRAEISYLTGDGGINTWATFDGDADALGRAAEAEQNDRTPIAIEVWRGSVVAAELGNRWRWAENNPPGDTVPVVFLAVSFALLLLVVRLPIHRQADSSTWAERRRLLRVDLGLGAAATGAILLLAYGYWPGAILGLAALVLLGLSTMRRTNPRDRPLLISLG